jgi:hypothetical protein
VKGIVIVEDTANVDLLLPDEIIDRKLWTSLMKQSSNVIILTRIAGRSKLGRRKYPAKVER